MRALLIGNYGVGNFGDEALKEYFVRTFSEVEWTVVSANPTRHPEEPRTRGSRLAQHSASLAPHHDVRGVSKDVPRLPFGFRSVFTPWWRTLRALRRCDVVVFGGGTLFTDIESGKACALWKWHAFVAHCCGKPFVLAFQGVGPFRTRGGERRARWAVEHAAHVSVRDDASLERVRRWRNDVTLTFDPVFTYFADFIGPIRHNGKTLIVIPREHPTSEFFLNAKQMMAGSRFTGARILSFKPDDPSERAVCNRLSADLGGAPVVAVHAVADLERGLSDASLVFTQRYHGAIAALATRIPFQAVAQGAGDKLAALAAKVSESELFTRVRAGEKALREAMSHH